MGTPHLVSTYGSRTVLSNVAVYDGIPSGTFEEEHFSYSFYTLEMKNVSFIDVRKSGGIMEVAADAYITNFTVLRLNSTSSMLQHHKQTQLPN